MTYPKVSIVVLNWNNYKDTKECLESLAEITYPNYEVVVVDNGSTDGSTERLAKGFPQHIYIYNKENLGFAAGNNVGIKWAFGKGTGLFLILNNDVIVENRLLESLVDITLKDSNIGIVGPAVYDYYEPNRLRATGFRINYWKRVTTELDLSLSPTETDWLYGCCLLIRREVIDKIGYLYEPYFLSYEDAEYCVRAKKAGFKIVYEPRAKIWHKTGTTIGKIPANFYYYFYRNKLLFFKRNAPFYIKYLFSFYFSLYLILRIAAKLTKRDTLIAFAIKDALIDFWKGNFGKNKKIYQKA